MGSHFAGAADDAADQAVFHGLFRAHPEITLRVRDHLLIGLAGLDRNFLDEAGAHIFLGAKKENRFCLPFTRFLLHQPLGGVRGQASDITIEAEEILKMRARLIKEISVETGQPYEKVVADTERNFWMGAEEAVKYGLVGRIVNNASEV